jgi:membrane-associated protein
MHGYLIMLLMMFIEGASVTYVAAFLASLGVFNIFIVFLISIAGFIAEDIILYSIGRRWGKKFLVKQFYNKLRGKTLKKISTGIKKHPGKTITFVKFTPIIPIPGLLMIGASGVSWKKFLLYSVSLSVVYSLILTILGFYSGKAFNIVEKYIGRSDLIIGAAILLGIGVLFLVNYTSNKISKRM